MLLGLQIFWINFHLITLLLLIVIGVILNMVYNFYSSLELLIETLLCLTLDGITFHVNFNRNLLGFVRFLHEPN